jgi:hypothetical protein
MVKRVRRRVGRVAVSVSVGWGWLSFGEEVVVDEGAGDGGIVAAVVRGTAGGLWRRL